MDVDMISSSSSAAKDHMEMMTMMMQMEKLPDFCDPAANFPNTSTLPEIQFSNANTTLVNTLPIYHNPNIPSSSSPTLVNLPASTSLFMGNPVQETISAPPLHSNLATTTTKFRYEGFGPFLCNANSYSSSVEKKNSMAAMREMIFRMAAMQPIHIDPESVKPPKRRNVKISKDPQSVAARHRRERISERIRILQRLVPGGTKMDTASMLDEAVHYVKFLKRQVQSLEQAAVNRPMGAGVVFSGATMANLGYSSLLKACQPPQMVSNVQMLR